MACARMDAACCEIAGMDAACCEIAIARCCLAMLSSISAQMEIHLQARQKGINSLWLLYVHALTHRV